MNKIGPLLIETISLAISNNQEEISKHCHKTQKYQSIGINNLDIDVNIVKDKINELFGID